MECGLYHLRRQNDTMPSQRDARRGDGMVWGKRESNGDALGFITKYL